RSRTLPLWASSGLSKTTQVLTQRKVESKAVLIAHFYGTLRNHCREVPLPSFARLSATKPSNTPKASPLDSGCGSYRHCPAPPNDCGTHKGGTQDSDS